MAKLSVTIITLNEEDNLRRCLDSVKDLADETILVDSGSRDKTIGIAKEYGARIFTRKFDSFANQKNFALDNVRNEWVLSIDADEVISRELGEEIEQAIKGGQFDGYLIGRRNIILGKEIKYSRWSPDQHIWLWKKSKGRWKGDVHEEVVVDGRVGKLSNRKIHYQSQTLREFMKSNDFYSTLEARNLHKKNISASFLKTLQDSLFEFSVRFIYKRGFLDGWRGLVLSLAMAKYRLDVWTKLRKFDR